MILLEPGNRILAETVSAQILGGDEKKESSKEKDKDKDKDKGDKREPIDVRLCDFDDVSYRVVIDAKSKNILTVSMALPAFREIKDFGAQDAVTKAFGDKAISAIENFDVSIQVNLDTEDKKEETIKKISLIKPTVIGGVFRHFYTKLQKGEAPAAPFKFNLRGDTTVYFIPDKDRVVTVFGLDFKDKVDKAVAKVFMNEFVDSRKTIGFAPPVSWGVTPPSELKTFGITEPIPGCLGFISFAILKEHVAKEDTLGRVVDILQGFRNYIQYHIKCSKSYFHSRMRARARDLLKVLNRAKQVDPDGDNTKGKKTITGRTFTRAA